MHLRFNLRFKIQTLLFDSPPLVYFFLTRIYDQISRWQERTDINGINDFAVVIIYFYFLSFHLDIYVYVYPKYIFTNCKQYSKFLRRVKNTCVSKKEFTHFTYLATFICKYNLCLSRLVLYNFELVQIHSDIISILRLLYLQHFMVHLTK